MNILRAHALRPRESKRHASESNTFMYMNLLNIVFRLRRRIPTLPPRLRGVAIALTAAVVVVAIFGVGTAKQANTQFGKRVAREGGLTVESRTAETQLETGAAYKVRVRPDQTPHSLEDELSLPPIRMIIERQTKPQPPQLVTKERREVFAAVVEQFLTGWETFRPGMDQEVYAASFSPVAERGALAQMVTRYDSHQPNVVSLRSTATTGSSYIADALDARSYIAVRRLDAMSALVTTQGVVRYEGGRLDGSYWRRSYSLVLRRDHTQWRVARVAADTLAAYQGSMGF